MFKKIIPLLAWLPTVSSAALLNLSDTPLYLGATVDPNIFFEVDDSGSMDWEILTPKHWHFCAYDPYTTGSYSSTTHCGYEITNGLTRSYENYRYRYFTYLYETGDNLYPDNCYSTSYNAVYSCPSQGNKDWRVFSSDLNQIYYDPAVTYTPWAGPCYTNGNACPDASFTSARSNPRQNSRGYSMRRNLAGQQYHVWLDTRGYSTQDGRPLKASRVNATNVPNGEVDLWDGHMKFVLNSSRIDVYKVSYQPTRYTLGKNETLLGRLNGSACYNVLGPKAAVEAVYEGQQSVYATNGEGCRTLAEAKTNFANWYQYSRKRSLAAKAAIGHVITDSPTNRYGLSVINQYTRLFVETPGAAVTDYTSHNMSLLSSLYGYAWPALGTPLRRGLERVGQYYDNTLWGKRDPIIHSCQQNFAVLLTDGYWNGSNPSSSIGDRDNDGISRTLADVARHYYLKDLSPLTNNVIPNVFDPATHQHMVTFTVGFGVGGNLVDTDGDGWPNPPLQENSHWGNPYSNNASKIDDLWHAAFNSKGTYISAKTPSAITAELGNILSNIADRVSSATAASQNSTTLQTDSAIYAARFDSHSWLGELFAYPISLQGQVSSTPSWNANCLLTGGICQSPAMTAADNPGLSPNERVIITRDWANNGTDGVPFRWPSNHQSLKENGQLPTQLAALLKYAPHDANTATRQEIRENRQYGRNLINYLRGNRTHEVQNGGTYGFRDRIGILGDIIHSDPLFIPPPSRYLPDNLESASYSAFKTTHQNRPNMIFAGANDGMVHGFLASSGEEILAYIPGIRGIYDNLASLSTVNYQHKNFVDGPLNEGDVFINNSWKTVLISGLRNGGQGIFALDVTDPNQFKESNAKNILLWEFTDEHDPDLGYVHGQVPIVKVRTGANTSRWAALVGNGYNNSEPDTAAAGSGQAALFVLFIEKGLDGTWTLNDDYIKIPVGASDPANPNGLATPYPVDVDGDYITDYVYAGDLTGKIWKFDLRNTVPSNWHQHTIDFFQAYHSTPGDQPITAPLIVGPHPNGLHKGVMIYFGTGKFLEISDNTTSGQATQTFYGLWDPLNGTLPTHNRLLTQSILKEVSQSYDNDKDGVADVTYHLRQISDHSIHWAPPTKTGDPAQHLGWKLNLQVVGQGNQGERQITRPVLRNNNIIFTTLIPAAQPCDFGGTSWLMELNAANGGQTRVTPFDLTNDGTFDTHDYINLGDIDGDGKDDYTIANGKKSNVGIISTPAIFMSADKQVEYKVSNGSQGIETTAENPGTGPQGRQSWRQLMP